MGNVAQTAAAEASAATQATELAAQVATAKTEGAKEMQARIQSIQGCEEAKGREKLAAHLAFNTAMGADEAKALLAAAPQEAATVATANALAAGMAGVTNPAVGADAATDPINPQAASAALWGRSNNKLRAVK